MDSMFSGMMKAHNAMMEAAVDSAQHSKVVVVPGSSAPHVVAAAHPPIVTPVIGAYPPVGGPGFGAYPPVGGPGFGAYPPVGGPGFGAYPPAVAPFSVDPLFGYFSSVAGADQQIDQKELQHCLTTSGLSGTYQPFSIETCTLMINMLDRDYSGKMGFNEFKELWTVLNQWKQTFMTYDRDRSGQIDGNELLAALSAFGYRLSPQAIGSLVRRYGVNNQIPFDAFVACAVRLRGLTDFFRRKDIQQSGNATMAYDEFITSTMTF